TTLFRSLRRLRIEARGRLVEDRYPAVAHQQFGNAEALTHAARIGGDRPVGGGAESHPLECCRDALLRQFARHASELRRIGEVLPAGHHVVEADCVRQVADLALDLQRPAQRVLAQDADASLARFREAEQHQDRRGLARAVGAEQADHLALVNGKVDAGHGHRFAIALGEALRFENDRAHRRPYLITAPPSTSAATAITPSPTAPHIVEVLTVTRNCTLSEMVSFEARTATM